MEETPKWATTGIHYTLKEFSQTLSCCLHTVQTFLDVGSYWALLTSKSARQLFLGAGDSPGCRSAFTSQKFSAQAQVGTNILLCSDIQPAVGIDMLMFGLFGSTSRRTVGPFVSCGSEWQSSTEQYGRYGIFVMKSKLCYHAMYSRLVQKSKMIFDIKKKKVIWQGFV